MVEERRENCSAAQVCATSTATTTMAFDSDESHVESSS